MKKHQERPVVVAAAFVPSHKKINADILSTFAEYSNSSLWAQWRSPKITKTTPKGTT